MYISNIHCEFELEEHGGACSVKVTDKSSNGTLINNKKIPKNLPQVLTRDDIVSLAQARKNKYVCIANAVGIKKKYHSQQKNTRVVVLVHACSQRACVHVLCAALHTFVHLMFLL
jgi:hypothetical protein